MITNTTTQSLLRLITITLAIATTSCSKFKQGNNTKVSKFDRDLAIKVIELTNKERAKHGLKALKEHKGLSYMSHKHSIYQCEKQGSFMGKNKEFKRISHFGFEGRNHTAKYKYNFDHLAENVGVSWADPKNHARQTVKGWMESKKHREAILTPGFTHVGVGIHRNGMHAWSTQLLGVKTMNKADPFDPDLYR